MRPNVPLLRKVVEWVEEQSNRTEDREWYQGDWFISTEMLGEGWCDSAFCVAGKVVLDAGWKPTGWWGKVCQQEQERGIDEVAEELLGLPEGHGLFAATNTAADIRRIAEDIAGERL